MFTEVRQHLWRWELPHPDWAPEEAEDGGWEETVASYAALADGQVLLLDPLAPPHGSAEAERFWRALDDDVEHHGSPAVLVTIFWHARSAREVSQRYDGATVWVHEPAHAPVAERTPVTDTFRLGDDLPGGAVAYDGGREGEVLYWLPSHRALVAGDALLGAGPGAARVCPTHWIGDGHTRDDVRRSLQPLLELPVDLLLLTHGDAIADDARGALERALA
jgi:hypothetical protein